MALTLFELLSEVSGLNKAILGPTVGNKSQRAVPMLDKFGGFLFLHGFYFWFGYTILELMVLGAVPAEE